MEPKSHNYLRNDDPQGSRFHEVEKLLELAYALASRFQGAREHWQLMQVINKLIHSAATVKKTMVMQQLADLQSAPRPSAEQALGVGHTSLGAGDMEAVDVELFNDAIGYLDRCPEYGGLVT